MKLSTRGRYATRIMVCLASRNGVARPVSREELARSQEISEDYAGQILMSLRRSGLIESHRGVKGGFTLARPPEEITVADVLAVTEGPLAIAPCGTERCGRHAACVARPVWEEAAQALSRVLSGTTIGSLADKAREAQETSEPSFDI
ncbi:RrF2 family transcriptional regulator [Verrucomicrobiota bacterium]